MLTPIKLTSMNVKEDGFSVLEILIAFSLLTLAISGVIVIVFSSQSFALDSHINAEALQKANTALEQARGVSNLDFNLVNPVSQASDGIYQKITSVKLLPDLFTKQVTSTVSWPGEHGRNLNIELGTLITNPAAVSGGDTCSSVLSGDWSKPQKIEYELGRDILNDTSSGFPITSLQSFFHKLYITVNNTSGNNNGTFFILDITHPESKPSVISTLDNNTSVGEGLNAVAVDGGKYAYVANAHNSNFGTCNNNASCSQLQVIDISVTPPVLVKTYKVPGVTGTGGQGIGKSILYKNGIVYLGLAKATGPEFNIIDVGGGGTVGASPANPVLLGSFELNSAVNALFIKGHYAYIASPDNEELKVLNIGVPATPIRVGGFDAPGGGANNGNGKSIAIVGNTIYFGRTLLSGNEFYILNKLNPETSLPILGSIDIRDSGNNTSINGIIVRDYLTFLVTNEQLQIFRTDNPSSVMQYATPLSLPPGTGSVSGTASDCEDNYIYIGSQGPNNKGYISVITAN